MRQQIPLHSNLLLGISDALTPCHRLDLIRLLGIHPFISPRTDTSPHTHTIPDPPQSVLLPHFVMPEVPRVGGLTVKIDRDGTIADLPLDDEQYLIVEAVVHMALNILESRPGRESLNQVAGDLISECERVGRPHIYNYPPEDLPSWINEFLVKTRLAFPPIHISDAVAGEAEIRRRSWGLDIRAYYPSMAGNMYLSKAIIENMVYARRYDFRACYGLFKFQLGIGVAHEIIHLLTGYFTGSEDAYTPPRVTMFPFGEKKAGEAGRHWEKVLLRGTVEFWAPGNPDTHTMGVRQPGKAYMFTDGHRNAVGHPVSMDYIREIVNGGKSVLALTTSPENIGKRSIGKKENIGLTSPPIPVVAFPVRLSSEPQAAVTRDDLIRAGCVETTHLRTPRRRRRAPPIPPPPPGGSIMPY